MREFHEGDPPEGPPQECGHAHEGVPRECSHLLYSDHLFLQDPEFRDLWNPRGWSQAIENVLSYSARILVSCSAPQPRA